MRKQPTDTRLVRKILHQAKPFRFQIIAYFLLSIVATPLALLSPLPMKLIVDNVIGKEKVPNWGRVVLPDSISGSSENLLLFSVVLFFLITVLMKLRP